MIIAPSGLPCMRSLACKSHSLASKRAVLGRKKDFDLLLADYMIAHPSRASANKGTIETTGQLNQFIDKEKLLATVEGTNLSTLQSTNASQELASKKLTLNKSSAHISSASPSTGSGQGHNSAAKPLVQRTQFSSYRVFSELKLSSWLTEPLKLYSRSRVVGQQQPPQHDS